MQTIFLSIFVVSFCISLTPHHFAYSCIFKSPEASKKQHGLWDVQSHSRKLYSPKCSCGALSPKPPWIINITTPYKNCTATIITSNLIATSHKCLTIVPDKKIQVYDTWNPRPKLTAGIANNIVTLDIITLSSGTDTSNKTGASSVKVKQIILSPRYALSTVASDGVIEDDLALLLIDGNLFKQGYSPICIPTLEEGKTLDVIHQSSKYHDLIELTQMRQGEHSVIVSGADCNANLKKSHSSGVMVSNDSFCVQYISSAKLNEGGSLTITSASEDKRVFLVGVASSTGKRSSLVPIFKYAYFTNIFTLVKYIEYHAHKTDSFWCESAPLKLGPKVDPPTGTKPGDWKKLKPTRDREETLDCACGILNNATQGANGRIAGGVEAEAYAYPWMVMLAFAFGHRRWFLCGGSIINDRMILTASHCVINKEGLDTFNEATETKALQNKHNYKTDNNQRPLDVDTIYFHPDYVEGQKVHKIDNDIAIITLTNPLNFSTLKEPGGMQDIRPVCLPKMSNPRPVRPGEVSLVIGWGLTNPDNKSSNPDNLQKLDAPILPESQCQHISGSINENMICAGYRDRFRDAAKGDSGGPLMVWDKTHFSQWGGQLVQMGLVSFGQDFRNDKHDPNKITSTLGVYTNVQKFMNIIDFFAEMEGAKWCKPPS